MPSTASTALNPGSNALVFTSSTSTDTFHVRIPIKHSAKATSASTTTVSHGDHLEVIPLHLTSFLSALHAHVLTTCSRIIGASDRNGQKMMVADEKGDMGKENCVRRSTG